MTGNPIPPEGLVESILFDALDANDRPCPRWVEPAPGDATGHWCASSGWGREIHYRHAVYREIEASF